MPGSAPVTLLLDAGDLDAMCAFWGALLGYRVVETRQAESPAERRLLRSESYPEVDLELRRCLPRPPTGSTPGSLRGLVFAVEDPIAVASRIDDPHWIAPPPADGTPARAVTLQDPSGYHVSLAARRPGDSA